MEHAPYSKYIPVGCLKLSADEAGLAPELWTVPELRQWRYLAHASDALPDTQALPKTAQAPLAQSLVLQPYLGLISHRWIQLQFSIASDSDVTGIIRVYILPHDVDRGVINREDRALGRAMSVLLSQLDYSPACWNGESKAPAQSSPSLNDGEPESTEPDASLLQMFNDVPSPDPRPSNVSNLDAREAMQWLLDSSVSGLQTDLFPYQRRSAALMLQRELEPGRMIDPRLQHARDLSGISWYYDIVRGLVLREPRYYDGVCGGILAEEMGTGKTLICLALILATRQEPTKAPEPLTIQIPTRPKVGSLLEMAAAATNRHSIAWRPYFEACQAQHGLEYERCISALERRTNLAIYEVSNPLVETRKGSRVAPKVEPQRQVYLSSASLIIVPNNLVTQWQQEIKKHTSGLKVCVIVDRDVIPAASVLMTYDIILFSQTRFEKIAKERANGELPPSWDLICPLEHIRFKRCIIDEGHKLGNNSQAWRGDALRILDGLQIAAKWVVTGTPSKGLYGTEKASQGANDLDEAAASKRESEITAKQEKEDLQRIGNITAKYLKLRPWCNTKDEIGDTRADWSVYVMQRKHHNKSGGRKDCLKRMLGTLIIRHQLSDVKALLPLVNERVVILDGSFQDKLSLNLFSMMIIFNSVQSQREDMDYFFHPRQRKSLMQLVNNLKQASFFGGVFYSVSDIKKSLETAEEFLEKKQVSISAEDEDLLRQALAFGKMAVENRLKHVSNEFHAMPLYLDNFPGGNQNGKAWSLDHTGESEKPICTDAGLVLSLQKFLNPCIDAPASLQLMIDSGRLETQGIHEREHALEKARQDAGETTGSSQPAPLAGNTALGDDHQPKPKTGTLAKSISLVEDLAEPQPNNDSTVEIAEGLARTRIISTVSAKLSYLIDAVVKYQDEEQIIIFYENDNVAYYLASAMEILQIKHLIYTRAGLSADRRALYVATFTHNPTFRVLLMDISQAAFGLDMRSASRIYFISPILNPQVEQQAIGRARRISQQKPVTVETLVLRDSIEEVIVERRKNMTQAEHSKVKSILDDRPMYNWILNAKITPLPEVEEGVIQTAMLKTPQFVFGRGFGRTFDPDEDLLTASPEAKQNAEARKVTVKLQPSLKLKSLKRTLTPSSPTPTAVGTPRDSDAEGDEGIPEQKPKKRAKIVWADGA